MGTANGEDQDDEGEGHEAKRVAVLDVLIFYTRAMILVAQQMALPDDIEGVISRRFATADVAAVRELLEGVIVSAQEGARVVRCVLHLAGGDGSQVARYAEAARIDARAVMWWAEYDGGEAARLRDFSRPMT